MKKRAIVSLVAGLAMASVAAWLFLGVNRAGADLDQQLKIYLNQSGLYRVTGAQMRAAGFDFAGVDPDKLRLTNKGNDVPIIVRDATGGVFDDADYLEFYGQAPQSDYTREAVYWLDVATGTPARITGRDGTPGGAPTADSFIEQARFEQDTFYWNGPLGDTSAKDHWFWDGKIADGTGDPSSRPFPFDLQDLKTGDVSVTATLQGRTGYDLVDPDHRTKIKINGTDINTKDWDGAAVAYQETTAVASLFNDGGNTLTLEALPVAGVSWHSLHLNRFEIAYPRGYRAQSSSLYFGAPGPGPWNFQPTDFSTDDIEVFDITNPNSPIKIENAETSGAASQYQAAFEDSATAGSRYLALTTVQRKSPSRLVLYQPGADLRSLSNGADYILITDATLTAAAQPLIDHRVSRGLRAIAVTTTDIYDQFAGGYATPQAIKDFLAYAYNNWQGAAPQYVTLLGDAVYDYTDNMGSGEANIVPTHLFESAAAGQIPTDNWFVDVAGGDRIPEMYVGRLPAKNAGEASAMISKIIDYENTPASGWNQIALFVADDDLPDFEDDNNTLISGLPAGYTAKKAYIGQLGTAGARAALLNGLNDGALITNYNGHGSLDIWANPSIFASGDVESLTNAGRLSFVSTLNCLNGFFINIKEGDPTHPMPLAEALIRAPNKGAVGVFSPTGLGSPVEYDEIGQKLFDLALNQDVGTLGAITTGAKVQAFFAGIGPDNLDTMTLFGDPATNLATDKYNGPEPTGTVTINSNAVFTNNPAVNLNFSGVNAATMRSAETTAALAGATFVSYDTSTVFGLTGVDGTKTVYAQFKSSGGKVSSGLIYDTIILDTVKPNNPDSVVSPSHFRNIPSNITTITIDFSGAGDSLSGLEGYSASWTVNASSTPPAAVNIPASGATTETTTSSALGDGSWWFNLRTKDNAGNWTSTSTVNYGPFIIETGAPSTVANVAPPMSNGDNSWYTSYPLITLSADESATTYYSWDSTAGPAVYTGPFQPQSDGPHTLYYYSIDSANNTEAVQSRALKFDTAVPTGSIVINSGAAMSKTSVVNVGAAAADGGSGVTLMRFKNEGGDWSLWEPYALSKIWTLTPANGDKHVYAQFRDLAGNVSTLASDNIMLDTVGPSTSVSAPPISTSGSKSTAFKVSWSGVDPSPSSGLVAFDVQFKIGAGGSWTDWKSRTADTWADFTGSPGKTYYFRARAIDGAGNAGAWSPIVKTIVPIDQNSKIVKRVGFAGTVSKASSNYYLGTARYSTTAGDEITYTFAGNYFALIGTKGPKFSKAVVIIDGVKKTIDAKASTKKFRQVLMGKSLGLKKHVVKIKNLGTPGRPRFDIDGLAVGK